MTTHLIVEHGLQFQEDHDSQMWYTECHGDICDNLPDLQIEFLKNKKVKGPTERKIFTIPSENYLVSMHLWSNKYLFGFQPSNHDVLGSKHDEVDQYWVIGDRFF